MKRIVIFIFLFIAIKGYAQADSTTLKYGFITDKYLSLISSMEEIQLISVTSNDTMLYGKKFFLYIQEYRKGTLINEDSLDMTCIEKRIPAVVGKDTIEYVLNTCDHITYTKNFDSFEIIFAGKIVEDSLKLYIRYPTIRLYRKLKAGKDYTFRPFQTGNGNAITIPLDKKTPVLLLSPPFKLSNSGGSYCIIDGKPIDSIYRDLNVRHFYVFSMAIK